MDSNLDSNPDSKCYVKGGTEPGTPYITLKADFVCIRDKSNVNVKEVE